MRLTRSLSMLLAAAGGLASVPAAGAMAQAAPDSGRFIGSWHGTLQAGATALRLALSVSRDSTGALAGFFTSLDQGNARIEAALDVRGDTLKASMPSIGGEYAAIAASRDTLLGTLRQGGGAFPLRMVRGAAPAAIGPRPQEPASPLPYRTREVEISSVPGVRLSGTLSLPEGPGPFPAVVLVSGSGAQDRDEALMGHRPFLVLSDHLVRRGIATLRYDDRGVGRSTGRFDGSTTADFADDAEAALRFVRGTPGVARDRVGIVGHSEGAMIGPMLAARSRDVAFVVLLAGPGVRGDSLLLLQTRALLAAAGAPADVVKRTVLANRRIYAAIMADTDSAETMRRVRAAEADYLAATPASSSAAAESALRSGRSRLLDPWTRFFLRYDPAPPLRGTRVPVLALNGTLDLQVPHATNLRAIAAALEAGGNRDYETVALPGLNHLFQTARTGAVSEYATIEETMAPAMLARVAEWITARFGPR